MLDAVTVEPSSRHQSSVIWLHGLGADGNDFLHMIPELDLPDDLGVRFIFPHAPLRAITINGGVVMRAWYDVKSLDLDRWIDRENIEASGAQVEQWIRHEQEAGIAANRIVLAGFSQGGAIALHTGIGYMERLAGIIGLSTYLPDTQSLVKVSDVHHELPVFLAHGNMDPVVPSLLGQKTCDALTAKGYAVEWHTYPMAHSVCVEEIHAISNWLRKQLS